MMCAKPESTLEYENSQVKVSCVALPVHIIGSSIQIGGSGHGFVLAGHCRLEGNSPIFNGRITNSLATPKGLYCV